MPGRAHADEDDDLRTLVAALAEQVVLLRRDLAEPPEAAAPPPPEVTLALEAATRQRVPIEAGEHRYIAAIAPGAGLDPVMWWRRFLRFTTGSSAAMPERLDYLSRDDGITWLRRNCG